MKRLIVIASVLIAAIAIYSFRVSKGDECPPEGKADPKKGKHAELKPREKNLNKYKNRQTLPQDADYDKSVTIDGMYNSKDDSLWSEDKAASLSGYFFRAVDNGMESCNCFTEDKSKYSTNIYISPTPITKTTRMADCIVAVVMPFSHSDHADWTADKLNSKLGGKKIMVIGWMIYDFAKANRSIETNSNGSQPERRTIWGICPMTDLRMFDEELIQH